MPKTPALKTEAFVKWFRAATPYIHQFGGGTFVIAFGGEVIAENEFQQLTHDINVLVSLEIRVVIVHGTRPQIDEQMRQHGVTPRFVNNRRVTDDRALACVKEANGIVRVEMEALMSMELANSPMWGADIRVSSGNFVTAKPVGVVDGVDFGHTGEVRKIDAEGIRRRLDDHEVVLLSPVGFSPTGDVFNCTLEDVATSAAIALKADKLIFLTETAGAQDAKGRLVSELTVKQAREMIAGNGLAEDVRIFLPWAVRACDAGVKRAHLISRHVDGALLIELFTSHGIGTMVVPESPERLRDAVGDDVPGIIQILEPLEQQGILVKREQHQLERDIGQFFVLESEGNILGCAALVPFPEDKTAELAALAVNPFYRDGGRGERMLAFAEQRARTSGFKTLFVLSTRTTHWFVERGFVEADLARLPERRRSHYNEDRRSKIFVKEL
ncbi:amino-acid N-acetyltransferase [Usitatibacter palustris]|uniref:Amino-acid acetyltransferase n=1 Tax=Usitatibacter palustris TaxID=2732487 RepID=A0A6M4HA46_9PROT|nr:amino-acid N-acetyltransferase [Usitatibacter palustris]QJR16426.1 Amino-acid acetyltransferase [Usitatibacter palustris]